MTLVSGEFILCRCDQRTGMIYTSRSTRVEIYDALEDDSRASGGSKVKYFEKEI